MISSTNATTATPNGTSSPLLKNNSSANLTNLESVNASNQASSCTSSSSLSCPNSNLVQMSQGDHNHGEQALSSVREPDPDAIKMFVGQIPRNMSENELKTMFQEYGSVYQLNVLRDKQTNESKGCCFVTFYTRKAALDAQNALHNLKTLPGMHHPIQMKPADTENRNERKLFIGMINRSYDENDIRIMFAPYGQIEDCTILRDSNMKSRGCAFVTYLKRQSAINAIKSMHHSQTMDGCSSPIVVKFADTPRDKETKKIQQFNGSLIKQFLNTNGHSNGFHQTVNSVNANSNHLVTQSGFAGTNSQHFATFSQQSSFQPINNSMVGANNSLNSQFQSNFSARQVNQNNNLSGNGANLIGFGTNGNSNSLNSNGNQFPAPNLNNLLLQQLLMSFPQIQNVVTNPTLLQNPPASNSEGGVSNCQNFQNLASLLQLSQKPGVSSTPGSNQSSSAGNSLNTSQASLLPNPSSANASLISSNFNQPLASTNNNNNFGLGNFNFPQVTQIRTPTSSNLSTNTNSNNNSLFMPSSPNNLISFTNASSTLNNFNSSSGPSSSTSASASSSTTSTNLVNNLSKNFNNLTINSQLSSNQPNFNHPSPNNAMNQFFNFNPSQIQQQSKFGMMQNRVGTNSNSSPNSINFKQQEGPDGCNLFIYHLPSDFGDFDLAKAFTPFGQVLSAKVFIDKSTNLSKCFGFVSYDNTISANKAIQSMNGYQIGIKRLKVQLKKSKNSINLSNSNPNPSSIIDY